MAKSSSGRTEPSFGGRSRTWPKLARTVKSPPRYLLMVLALAGLSTTTTSVMDSNILWPRAGGISGDAGRPDRSRPGPAGERDAVSRQQSPPAQPVPGQAGSPGSRRATGGSAAPPRQPLSASPKHINHLGRIAESSMRVRTNSPAGSARTMPAGAANSGIARGASGRCSAARPRPIRSDARPGGSGRWSRGQRGSSGLPGTANSSRPASSARRAVIRLPERERRLDHHHAERQAGDDAVAAGEVAGERGGAERRLGHHRAALGGDAGLQAGMLRRVGLVEPAGDAAMVRPRRSAPRCAAASMPRARPETTARPSAASCLGEVLRDAPAGGGGVAGADQGDRRGRPARPGRRARRGPAARPPASRAGADRAASPAKSIRPPMRRQRLHLPPRLGFGAEGEGRAAAGGRRGRAARAARRAAVRAEQPAEGQRPDAVGARKPQSGDSLSRYHSGLTCQYAMPGLGSSTCLADLDSCRALRPSRRCAAPSRPAGAGCSPCAASDHQRRDRRREQRQIAHARPAAPAPAPPRRPPGPRPRRCASPRHHQPDHRRAEAQPPGRRPAARRRRSPRPCRP